MGEESTEAWNSPSTCANRRKGKCLFSDEKKEAERVIRLSSVLFVPDLSCNLFSVLDVTDKGNRMMFDDITCNVITRGDVVIASGHKRGNLYVLDGTASQMNSA